MAFENGATSVLAIQPKPPLPRKTSEIVLPVYSSTTSGASGNDNAEDLIFDISMPGKPDSDSEVHFFVINTNGSETQIFPNKQTFYDSDLATKVANYEKDPSTEAALMTAFMDPLQTGKPYSYTVITDAYQVDQEGNDAEITIIGGGSSAWLYSASGNFTYVDAYDIDLDKQIEDRKSVV